MTTQQIRERMGADASDAEAAAMIEILKASGIVDLDGVDQMGDAEFFALIPAALAKVRRTQEMLGSHLTQVARRFGADEVLHLGGHCYVARRADGKELRMIADEGIGSVEGDEGFEEAWAKETTK